MISRPKPGDVEDDILKMQEDFLKDKQANKNHKPAAQVTNLRPLESTKRPHETGDRKPSKYALAKGLKSSDHKKVRLEEEHSCLGEIHEKNIEDNSQFDDKVYFPKAIPSVLGNIIEKNLDNCDIPDVKTMPSEGFPVAQKHHQNKLLPKTVLSSYIKSNKMDDISMDVDGPSTSSQVSSDRNLRSNLPSKSYILSSSNADEIHKDNIDILSKLSEKDILEERQKLLSTLDPNIVKYLHEKRQKGSVSKINSNLKSESQCMEDIEETIDDSLWENDILGHPDLNHWVNFDTLEKDKLQWMKGISESKQLKPNEPYEARFDFEGYLLPYTIEYTEKTKTLFHHGDEPHRPGYTISELIELSRSSIIQQRVMALNTIAGIFQYYNLGIYKDIIEIPVSKLFFVVRFAIDENITIILEPALKALRNLIYNRVDEASLDALIGFEEGLQQPCLECDKSEIEELESQESELKDFYLAEIDLISALLRTNIIQRLYYILETLKPTFNCVQYSIQILTRLSRNSVETATTIVRCEHLMKSIVNNFVPKTGINFVFEPEKVYGKPLLPALKLLRILSLQSFEINNILVTKYGILKSLSEYISSGVDGTYGLRIQIESLCILTNLLHYTCGLESAISLFPVIITALYKHVKGTDVFVTSSVAYATHAAVVLQFINTFLKYNLLDMQSYKEQIYPLLKDGVQKWVKQLTSTEVYTCGHLRLLSSILDCCKTVFINENITMKFLNELLKTLALSRNYKQIIKHLIPSSNLLSDIETKELHLTDNLRSLGTTIVGRSQKNFPLLNTLSPIPFMCSLFKLLCFIEDKSLTYMFVQSVSEYLNTLAQKVTNLCDNWFTRIETDLLFFIIKVSMQSDISESNKDLVYTVSNKLCYLLRMDKKYELNYILSNIVFNQQWFTTDRLLNLVSISDSGGFSKVLKSMEDIRMCYSNVINVCFKNTEPKILLQKWQDPILPRDWIYLPILMLYTKSQEMEDKPKVIGYHASKVAQYNNRQKELIVGSSLEWILIHEMCFPDLLKDIDVTDRFCRITCVFLCDNSIFLNDNVRFLLSKCLRLIFKKKNGLNFDKPLSGLSNFQVFYTQLLEQFQSVSYGDETFAMCVLVPLAQRHSVKWRKIMWSEYAGCLRALDCPEDLLCYDINEYLYPVETDESLIRSYFHALSGNLLRPGTIAYRIAQHHVQMFKNKT